MESLRSCNSCLLPETYETLELASDDSSCNMCEGTEFKQKEVDERILVDDSSVISIIEKMLKQRNDSIEAFKKANRVIMG